MPLIFNKKLEFGTTQILVWENNEGNDFFINELNLSQEECCHIQELREHRQHEWLCSRYLIKLLLPENSDFQLTKDEYGKPFLTNSDKYISISHSRNRAAVIISNLIVGVDIQKEEEKIDKIYTKFISPKQISRIDSNNTSASYHIFWGAKEAMYKGWGKKELSFQNNLHVYPFKYFKPNLELKGWVKKDDYFQKYDIFSELIDDFYLVYSIMTSEEVNLI